VNASLNQVRKISKPGGVEMKKIPDKEILLKTCLENIDFHNFKLFSLSNIDELKSRWC